LVELILKSKTKFDLKDATKDIPRKCARPSNPSGSQKQPTATFMEAAAYEKNVE
jgi:hypothetical protein